MEAKIVIDEVEHALKVPNGALFRFAEDQSLFVLEHGTAMLRSVTIGRRGRLESEVTSGVSENESVIIYPSDKVLPGVAVRTR